MNKEVEIEELIGKTLSKIDKTEDEIIFHCTDGSVYNMYHPVLFHNAGHVTIVPLKGVNLVSVSFKRLQQIATNKAFMSG